MRRGFTRHYERATIAAYRREIELQAERELLTEATVATVATPRPAIDESELDPTPWISEPDHAAIDLFEGADGLEYIDDLPEEEVR